MLSGYPVALGTWSFGDREYWNEQNQEDSLKILSHAVSHGICHIDTAFSYGKGRSEQLIGRFLKRTDRSKLIIATKINTYDPSSVEKRLIQSAKRMNTNHIDIAYLHWPKTGFDIIPIYRELARLRDEGLIRFIGGTNLPFDLLKRLHQAVPLDIYQTAYSLLWRAPEEQIIPFCREQGIITTAYSPLAQGLLAAEHKQLSPDDMRNRLVFLGEAYREQTGTIIDAVSMISRKTGKSMAQVSLDWIARRQLIDTMILGCRTKEQLSDQMGYHDCPLTDEDHDILTTASDSALHYSADNIFGHTW